jgi:4-amino-4-deoxy-L-arabinose transferase-like glycosyltransferase
MRLPKVTSIELTGVFAAAFLVRLYLATSSQLDGDEAFAYAPAALSYLQGNWAFNFEHPMVAKLLFAGSALLFGARGSLFTILPSLPMSIGAMRLVSVIMGSAICIAVWWLVREITGNYRAAAFSAVLLAFDPISVGESSYALLEPTTAFFYITSVVLFHRYVRRNGFSIYLSALMFGLAVASKYYAVMGFLVFIGILLSKRKLSSRASLKALAVLALVALGVFFAVQPYLWQHPIENLYASMKFNSDHLQAGHLVKPPGPPFLIPQNTNWGEPWPVFDGHPVASKPDIYASKSGGVQSPVWYLCYIQALYSTPFELLIYPIATAAICLSASRRKTSSSQRMAILVALVPSVWFAFQTVRLPQYAMFISTSWSLLAGSLYVGSNGFAKRMLFGLLVLGQVMWTCWNLVTASIFTGWGFYVTPLTEPLTYFFGWLWTWAGVDPSYVYPKAVLATLGFLITAMVIYVAALYVRRFRVGNISKNNLGLSEDHHSGRRGSRISLG